MYSSYRPFIRIFTVWREEGKIEAITTCRCHYFMTCGCWSVKLLRPAFARRNDYCELWKFEGYFFKLWFSLVSRVLLRNGTTYSKAYYGVARRPAVESLCALGGRLG